MRQGGRPAPPPRFSFQPVRGKIKSCVGGAEGRIADERVALDLEREEAKVAATQPLPDPATAFIRGTRLNMAGLYRMLVLEGGHWCPQCERESWNYAARAKVDPFFAQVWNPLHSADEPQREYRKEVSELDVP